MLRVLGRELLEVELLDVTESAGDPRDDRSSHGTRMPWEEPGWLIRTGREFDEGLREVGLQRVEPIEQHRHTSVGALLRTVTNLGPVWLKTGLPSFSNEGSVTRWLATWAESHVPNVLVAKEDWWIAAEFLPAEAGKVAHSYLETMALIQLEGCSRLESALAAGCPRREPAALLADLRGLAAGDEVLPTPRGRAVLSSAFPEIELAVEEAAGLPLSATVVHGDLAPYNVRPTRNGWLIYDWTDVSIAFPFSELAATLCFLRPSNARRELRGYADIWRQHESDAVVASAVRLAPCLGAAHQVANYARIMSEMGREAQDQSSYTKMAQLLEYWIQELATTTSQTSRAPRRHVVPIADGHVKIHRPGPQMRRGVKLWQSGR